MEEDDVTYAILESSRFWVQKVLVPILLCVGLVGNTITVMVLTRRRMRNSTNTYLSALAIADIIHLIFGFILSFKHYSHIHDISHELYWRFYGLTHWLCDAASATSAWLAVSFTVERYIAVCHPMKGKVFCTERRAKSTIAFVYIFCILTTASTTFEYQLTFNDECLQECPAPVALFKSQSGNVKNGPGVHNHVPDHIIKLPVDVRHRFTDQSFQSQLKTILSNCTNHPHLIIVLVYPEINNVTDEHFIETVMAETELTGHEVVLEKPPGKWDKEPNASPLKNHSEAYRNTTLDVNTTCCVKNFTIDVELTELGKSKTYREFIYWYSALGFGLIPLALIATFNCILVRAVYTSQQLRRAMTSSQGGEENPTCTTEKRITIMLIGIVFIFLICNTPTSCYLMYYYHFPNPATAREKNIMLILGNFFNLLLMFNAPCNFLIYCLLSKKFRGTFMKIFWERKKAQHLETEAFLLSNTKSLKKFNPYKHGLMKRNASEYRTPRNLETQSLTSIPRSKSLMVRAIGKARSTDLNV